MKQSPLVLNDYQLLEIAIKPEAGYVSNGIDDYPDITNTDFRSSISVGVADGESDPRDYLLSLKLEIKPIEANAFPYSIEIAVQGFVTVIHDLPIDGFDREDFAAVNGIAILYGVLRDTLLASTSRFIHGAIMLPTVNFLDLKKDLTVVSKKKKVVKKKSAKKKAVKKKLLTK